MASTTQARPIPAPVSPWLVRLDRNFRLFGKLTLALLLATAGLIAADVEAWTGVFLLAHLAALVALLPLGVMLVVRAFRDPADGSRRSGAGVVLRRYRLVAALLGLALVTVVLSLVNFEDGNRVVRRAANLSTVGIVWVLVWRYLVWSREHLPRR